MPEDQPQPEAVADFGFRTVQRLMTQEWMSRAECASYDPEIFFPPGPTALAHIARARAICRSCPVVLECRAAAVADPRITGIWGGTTETERVELRARGSRRAEGQDTRSYARLHVDLRPGGPGAQTAGRA